MRILHKSSISFCTFPPLEEKNLFVVAALPPIMSEKKEDVQRYESAPDDVKPTDGRLLELGRRIIATTPVLSDRTRGVMIALSSIRKPILVNSRSMLKASTSLKPLICAPHLKSKS